MLEEVVNTVIFFVVINLDCMQRLDGCYFHEAAALLYRVLQVPGVACLLMVQ